jgi:hypothetical protein
LLKTPTSPKFKLSRKSADRIHTALMQMAARLKLSSRYAEETSAAHRSWDEVLTREWVGLQGAGVSVSCFAETHMSELSILLDASDLARVLSCDGQ